MDTMIRKKESESELLGLIVQPLPSGDESVLADKWIVPLVYTTRSLQLPQKNLSDCNSFNRVLQFVLLLNGGNGLKSKGCVNRKCYWLTIPNPREEIAQFVIEIHFCIF